MNPAAKALGVVALVVFGSVMSIKKFGFWKSLAGGTGLLFANYFATGHFSPLRTVGDIFSTTSEFTSAAVKSITETLEKDRNKPVNDPEVLAQIILNETAGFRDGEFDEYFTNPKNDGSSEDARRYIIQALANGVPEF